MVKPFYLTITTFLAGRFLWLNKDLIIGVEYHISKFVNFLYEIVVQFYPSKQAR